MNVRIESMSHGDGKVYLQMVLDRLTPQAEVLLDAHLKDGTKIPAHLFPFVPIDPSSAANYVVVLPCFEVREVDLTFVEYSGEGSPLGQSRLTVEMNMMRWRTRFNALVHNELIAQMFDIEREYCANRMNIFFTQAIDDGDEIVVKMLVDMPHIEGADIMVDFSDRWGNEIDLPVYPLIDEVVSPTEFGDSPRLHIGFSVRVRSENKDFCATVYDANELISGGFAHFCDETYESLRDSYMDTMADASQDEEYEQWYRRHCETLAGLASQRERSFSYQPIISLVLPLFKEDVCYLPATLMALSQQTYSAFELVVVDCGVDEATFNHTFREWQDDDRLVHIAGDVTLDEATARVSGIVQSRGEICAVLDPRIILAPEALFEYVRLLNKIHSENEDKAKSKTNAKAKGKDQAPLQASESPDLEEAACAPDGAPIVVFPHVKEVPCDVAYANHDYFDRELGFHDPQLKPVYSPDLLYSYFYAGPLIFISRSLIDTISQGEGFSSDAFEYDLMLKASNRANRIERIDKVLYHIQDAACISAEAEKIEARREEEAFRLGRKALALHLRRLRIDAVVLSEISERIYKVKYRLPEHRPSLSIIIPIKDEVELLDTCLSSLVEHDTLDCCEIVIVDNGSTDPATRAYLAELDCKLPRVQIVSYDKPYNPPAIANAAAALCKSDYLLFLDNDTEAISEGAISALLADCLRSDVGVVGAKLLYPDDTVQHAGIMVGAYGSAGNIAVNMARSAEGYAKRLICSSNVSAVSSSVMMVKRSVFLEVGGFDERFMVSCHDVDFCLKVNKAGYRVVFDGGIEFYHQENATSGHTLTEHQLLRAERERAFLHYRWPRYFIKGDPYFSESFDKDSPYFRLS